MRAKRRKNISPQAVRQIPQRTCVACRSVKAKRDLVRVVRAPGGSVELDITGKQAGRGAYLCRTRECWEVGLKRGRLEHSLRTKLSPDDRERLVKLGQEYCEGRN